MTLWQHWMKTWIWWINSSIIKNSLNFRGHLLCNYLYFKKINSLFKCTQFMYTMYASASNNIPSYTHVSSYVVWRVHPHAEIQPNTNLLALLNKPSTSNTNLLAPNTNPSTPNANPSLTQHHLAPTQHPTRQHPTLIHSNSIPMYPLPPSMASTHG
jgi:hypothetical protein